MASRTRIANEAWEALFRAQATISRELTAAAVWDELGPHEYGVLYALASAPEGLRITDLRRDVLLTQPGLSRLIARLESRGLVERVEHPDDGRAYRIRLTDAGAAAQRHVGLRHGRHVAQTMTSCLSDEQLLQLRDLCHTIESIRT
jgi:DNA-binding MarR family transcriptional regulator